MARPTIVTPWRTPGELLLVALAGLLAAVLVATILAHYRRHRR
jgi:hypothetical protein